MAWPTDVIILSIDSRSGIIAWLLTAMMVICSHITNVPLPKAIVAEKKYRVVNLWTNWYYLHAVSDT